MSACLVFSAHFVRYKPSSFATGDCRSNGVPHVISGMGPPEVARKLHPEDLVRFVLIKIVRNTCVPKVDFIRIVIILIQRGEAREPHNTTVAGPLVITDLDALFTNGSWIYSDGGLLPQILPFHNRHFSRPSHLGRIAKIHSLSEPKFKGLRPQIQKSELRKYNKKYGQGNIHTRS